MSGTAAGRPRPRVALTVGKLDGVHAGHRHLAAHAQAVADSLGALSAAVVLHPDPATVLAGRAVRRLTDIDDRAARLRAFGVEIVEPWRFTPEVARMSPSAFLGQLVDRFEIAAMVVGPDFKFGRGRAGDLDALLQLGDDLGFAVHVVPPLQVAGEWVSSRRIRLVIESGDIALARTLLRAPPRVVGTVVHGAARGRQLGFPTANLDPTADFALPADGIYTVVAEWTGAATGNRRRVDGVASVGVRPTFDNGARLLEVHLIDFDGDLYGHELTVDFLAHQRPELRFDDVGELVLQMELDTELARATHRAESAPTIATGPDGRTARVSGRDLASLCEAAARVGRGRVPATGLGMRRALAVSGDDRDSLLSAWLARAGDCSSEPSVYAAGDGCLHALAVVDEHTHPPSRHLAAAGPIGERDDGWLEVEIDRGAAAA